MNLMVYEKKLWVTGIKRIACCDEVGRGCLFGPVVAAAVILEPWDQIDGVVDSKKIPEKVREQLYDVIMNRAVAVGIGEISVQNIETFNIKQASRMAMKLAIENLATKDGLPVQPEALLIDAETVNLPYPQESMIRGEDQVHGIAAASIIAKVTRDRMCREWHKIYPEYGLDLHKGYATKMHREALIMHGPTPLHRTSFLRNIFRERGHPNES